MHVREIAMREPAQVMYIEPRWPVALATIAILSFLIILPGRLRLFPTWILLLLPALLIVPMAALSLTAAKARWLRIESIATLLFLLIVGSSICIGLKELFSRMLHPTADLTGLQLLSSSVAVWVTNMLVFSIAYWRTDRGGPEARGNPASTKPDWLFAQPGTTGDAPSDWRPSFVDYLFLAFSTATAFSATGDLPLTTRAKLLMMLESTISLVTIITVAARAINILGS